MTEQPLNNARVSGATLPALGVFSSVLLTFNFVVLILSIVAGFRTGNMLLHPNPFATYEAVWPGQSVASLAEYGRQTTRGRLPCITGASPPKEYPGLDVRVAPGAYGALGPIIKCAYYLKDGMFRVVGVTIEDDQIRQLDFISDVLPEDMLLSYWGMPDSITESDNSQRVELYWEGSAYSAMASVVKSDSVVKVVTLRANE